MIIKELTLQNIRSYKSGKVEFPMGTTLFEGDIGSGKSTILMAIEFALFGLGSERGASLLRAREDRGSVSLLFEVDGKEYVVTRGLTRSEDKIQQTSGTLKTSQGMVHYAAVELKEKILDILNFNEPSGGRAQNVIYRYAVYTPQEEMKAILFMPADSRLQTLRKAFRIEDYKTAADNAKSLSGAIEGRANALEAASSDIPALEANVKDLSKRMEDEDVRLAKLSAEEASALKALDQLKADREGLRSQLLTLSGAAANVVQLESRIAEKRKLVSDSNNAIKSLELRIEKLRPTVEALEAAQDPTEKSQADLEQEIHRLEDELAKLNNAESQLGLKVTQYLEIQEKGVCPVCDRLAERTEYAAKLQQKSSEKEEAAARVDQHKRLLNETKALQNKKRMYDQDKLRLDEMKPALSAYQQDKERRKRDVDEATAAIEQLGVELELAKRASSSYGSTKEQVGAFDTRIKDMEGKLKGIRDGLSSASTSIRNWNEERQRNERQIGDKQVMRTKAATLKENQLWIEDYFIPTLSAIEKQVMVNIQQDFNTHFQKWFGILVEDPGKEVRIDEDYTPIVQQDGFEQDVNYMSGGEKTSVALAYRLALNSIVQKVSVGMKSNLLILDEPTDGFSKEQLPKVKEVLDELQSPQIVVVSHEKELESFADQVLRVTKVQGESKVEQLAA